MTATAVYLSRPVVPVLPTDPQPWPVASLPKHLYHSPGSVRSARVSFPLHLQPTADPLVWRYHPGHPPAVAPMTYEVHFDSPPSFPAVPPVTVTATVEGLKLDPVRRLNGVPGFIVLRHAVLPASP